NGLDPAGVFDSEQAMRIVVGISAHLVQWVCERGQISCSAVTVEQPVPSWIRDLHDAPLAVPHERHAFSARMDNTAGSDCQRAPVEIHHALQAKLSADECHAAIWKRKVVLVGIEGCERT